MNINRALRQGEQILVDGRLSERAVAITKNKIRTIYRIGILHAQLVQNPRLEILGVGLAGDFGDNAS